MRKTFYLMVSLLIGTAVVVVWQFSGSGKDMAVSNQNGNNSSWANGVSLNAGGEFGLGCMDKAISYRNLKLIPVCASEEFIAAKKRTCHYLPLKEALETQKVKISEKNIHGNGSGNTVPGNNEVRPNNFQGQNQVTDFVIDDYSEGASVNELTIENYSNDTVYIMGGEVVKGGKQDRVIAQDMVVPPTTEPMPFSVFCVEHGRWTPRELHDPNSNKMSADRMSFGSTYYVSASCVRKEAVLHKDQSEVWNQVKNVNANNSVSSGTGAYTDLENNTKYKENRDDYLSKFKSLAENNPDMIGVIAVSGDKVIACDIFSCPDLFRKVFEGLLHSYITDAISNGTKVTFTDKSAQEYLNSFLKDNKFNQDAIEKNGTISKSSGGAWMHVNMY